MADYIMFDEGANLLITSGIPAGASGCKFDLCTKSVGATSPYAASDAYAARTPTGGTGYAQQSKTRDTPATRSCTFGSAVSWATGSATDWSNVCRAIYLSNGSVGFCAWNLQTGGAARDMSQANTTENVTVTFGPITNP